MEKIKLFLSIIFCFAFFFLGDILALLGPTLLDIAHHVSGSDNSIPVIFSARSVGYLAGSITGGVLYDKYRTKRYAMLSISVVIAVLFSILIPFSPTLYVIIPAMFLQGIPMGVLDNGANILLLRLWEEKSGPYMQALHFSFGLGTFVAPLLAEPFIAHNAIPDIPTSHYCHPPDDTVNDTTNCTDITSNCTDAASDDSDFFTSIQFGWAYWISSFGMLLVAVPLIYFAACSKRRHPQLYQQIIAQKENTVATERRKASKANVKHYKMFWVFIVTSCAVFLFFYIGVEVTYGSYIFTFAVTYKELCFSKSKAALLNAVYWGSFTVGRLAGIGIAMLKVSTTIMLVSDFIGSMCAVLLMALFHTSDVVIWTGSALLGLSVASIFPSMMLWIDEHVEVTGKVTAVLVNGASLGDMVLPLTVGLLITNVDPELFLYLMLVYCSTATLVYITAMVVAYLWRRYYPSTSAHPVHYEPLQEPVGEDTEDTSENNGVTALSDCSIMDDTKL